MGEFALPPVVRFRFIFLNPLRPVALAYELLNQRNDFLQVLRPMVTIDVEVLNDEVRASEFA